jgi:hypothetical protein
LLGLSLGNLLAAEARAQESPGGRKRTGFGTAKNFIFVFLQGGPSHLDIWDPKPDAPDNIRGEFAPIKTKIPGVFVSEVMPNLAQVMDKTTLIRSVSYTPAGLFNHTAAIYQMMTGYTPDKVSPSGQLEPPNRPITRTSAASLPGSCRPKTRCCRLSCSPARSRNPT